MWVKKFELEGVDGLRDNYIKQTRKVLYLERATARDAVLVCAWWAFRIGNIDCIKNSVMKTTMPYLYQLKPSYRVYQCGLPFASLACFACDITPFRINDTFAVTVLTRVKR